VTADQYFIEISTHNDITGSYYARVILLCSKLAVFIIAALLDIIIDGKNRLSQFHRPLFSYYSQELKQALIILRL